MAVNDPIIGSELGPEFDQGVATPNQITIKVDGVGITKNGSDQIAVTSGVLSFDGGTNILTYTNSNGGQNTVDLSAFTTDIFVNGGSFDAASSVLTLTDNSGTTPDVTIDLSTLLGVSSDLGNLLVPGADGKAFFGKTDLDAQTTVLVSRFGTQIGRVVNV